MFAQKLLNNLQEAQLMRIVGFMLVSLTSSAKFVELTSLKPIDSALYT